MHPATPDQPGLNTGDEASQLHDRAVLGRRPFAQAGFLLWPDDCLYYYAPSGLGEALSVGHEPYGWSVG